MLVFRCRFKNDSQRAVLAAVWAFEIRLPITEVDDCNIADVLFISQIYDVLLELKQNSEQKADAYNVQPKLQKTQCCLQLFWNVPLILWCTVKRFYFQNTMSHCKIEVVFVN